MDCMDNETAVSSSLYCIFFLLYVHNSLFITIEKTEGLSNTVFEQSNFKNNVKLLSKRLIRLEKGNIFNF